LTRKPLKLSSFKYYGRRTFLLSDSIVSMGTPRYESSCCCEARAGANVCRKLDQVINSILKSITSFFTTISGESPRINYLDQPRPPQPSISPAISSSATSNYPSLGNLHHLDDPFLTTLPPGNSRVAAVHPKYERKPPTCQSWPYNVGFPLRRTGLPNGVRRMTGTATLSQRRTWLHVAPDRELCQGLLARSSRR
jgi:hypothetical protein